MLASLALAALAHDPPHPHKYATNSVDKCDCWSFPLYSQAAKLFTAMDKRVKHRQVGTSVYDAASTLFLNNNFDFCSSFPTFVKLILYILVENIRYILIS